MDINSKIKSVNEYDSGWGIETESGSGFTLDKKHKVTPKVGDDIESYCVRGCIIRSVKINGSYVFNKTDKDLDREHKEMVADMHKKKKKKFEEEKDELDATYDSLPPVFQRRLDRFRKGKVEFRWSLESYEMFCCQEALVIAKHCGSAEGVREFNTSNYAEQSKVTSDQHSGNTMGTACTLAYWYLECPDVVEYLHGALVPMTGCKDYGCTHSQKEKDAVTKIFDRYEANKTNKSKLRKLLILD